MSNDLLFKEMLCHRDNRKQLIKFLSLVTDLDEKIIRNNLRVQYDSILNKTKLSDKALRGYVVVTFDKYIINLESYSYFDERSLNKSINYVMRIFSTQLKQGKDYDHLESVAQINLIDNVRMKFMPKIINNYYLINEDNLKDKLIPDIFKMKYYRIDKAKEIPYNELNEEMRWIRFFGAESSEERRKLAEGDDLLMELNEWADKFIMDEQTKEFYGKWAEYIAEEKGKEIGKEEGITLRNKEIAKKMKEKGYSLKEIKDITRLSEEEIKKL